MQREEEQLTRKNTTVWSLMCQAVKKGDYESMKKILMTEKIRDQNCTGETVLSESPLHLAIAQGKDTFVDLLIENGIDISCTNLYGETPLHTACSSGNLEIAQKLLAAGSMLDCKDCGECTPLFHAVHANKPHVVKYLIHEGANLDTLNEELLSPLDHAILYNRKEIIGLLLKGGCALDKTEGLVYYPGHYSNSVLFSLWIDGDLDNVKILLEAGYKVTSSHLTTLFNVAKSLHWDDSLLHTVKSIVREPMTLKSTCRITIRKHIMNLKCSKNQSVQGMISLLPLPDILKTFVRMM